MQHISQQDLMSRLEPISGEGATEEMAAAQIVANALIQGGLALMVGRAAAGTIPRVLFVNEAFCRLTGFSLEEVVGRGCDFMRGPDTPVGISARLDDAMSTGKFCDAEMLHYRRDGVPFWNGVTISPLRGADGQTDFLILMRDVTARRRADDRLAQLAERLRDLAMSDPLTGIANRRNFDSVLEREWRRAGRSRSCASLAMIDIDHFKAFNDRFGHPTGDAGLKAVAVALRGVLRRPTDFVARYGGEEFAVLMPEIDAAAAAVIADRMVETVRALDLGGARQAITISCGIVTAWPHRYDGDVTHFVRDADRALYEAKSAGRNCVFQLRHPGDSDDPR